MNRNAIDAADEKAVAIDFDGVLNTYSSGWKGPAYTDDPVPGAASAITRLWEDGFRIIIYSTRANTPEGVQAIRDFIDNKLGLDGSRVEITDRKPIAESYIDDRAIRFSGDWPKTLRELRTFKPWIGKSLDRSKLVKTPVQVRLGGKVYMSFRYKRPSQADAKDLVAKEEPNAGAPGDIWSDAFRRWFGSSKVVDSRGLPLPVYHGSPDLRELKKQDTFMSQRERFGMGKETHVHWFTPSMGSAKTYADPHRAFDYQNAEEGVVTVYLKIENPLIVDAEGQAWRDAQRRGKTSDVIMEAMNTGHDGLIIRNVKDEYNNGPKTKPSDTYAVFSPEQIKSVDNEGSWSAKDRRIHKSLTWSGWKLQGRMNIHGMDISIENRKGSVRRGVDNDGHEWSVTMYAPYGRIRGTIGKDGDLLDCYIGPNPESTRVFIINQNDPNTGKFDEQKVMLGFNTPKEAKELYLKQYDRPGFFGSMDETDIDTFKEKAFSDNAKGRKIVAKAFPTAGYQANIEKETEGNSNFRRVLFTGPYSQLVVMNLKPGEDIGIETHERLDQFIRIEAGEGTSIIDGKERELKPGDGLIIPAGSAHNIIATTTLKLYAVYTKPEHPDKLIVKAKPKRLVVPALKQKRIGDNNQAGGHVV